MDIKRIRVQEHAIFVDQQWSVMECRNEKVWYRKVMMLLPGGMSACTTMLELSALVTLMTSPNLDFSNAQYLLRSCGLSPHTWTKPMRAK